MTTTEAQSGRNRTPDLAAALLTPEAVRDRASMVFAAAEAGALAHFDLIPERLLAAADLVARVIRTRYPDLKVPFHARWRHFVAGGTDHWQVLQHGLCETSAHERARIAFEVATTSVLLDAGAGAGWRYRHPATGEEYRRSEGLAMASLEMFRNGRFSSDPATPVRADAAGLKRLSADQLAVALQVSADNPLPGLENRAALLRALSAAIEASEDHFPGDGKRLGALYDHLQTRLLDDGTLPAREILIALLHALGPIWPGRLEMDGRPLGDTWRHPAVRSGDGTDGLIPFHKLSQWLAYSLIEPLEAAGTRVTGIGALTGLAEYRNGGLFIDTGVLALKDGDSEHASHAPGSELVVEWRALTVALLDRIAPLVRDRLGVSEQHMPLASILEGGTWAAGRQIAAEKRASGGPPLTIVADGTVF